MIWGNKSVSFDPKKDIPLLTDRVILVTGGNAGLGKQAVLDYARHGPGLIWLTARSVAKGNAAADEIRQQVPNARIEVLELDLSSFASVKKAASHVLASSTRLDILMLNAGIMATPPGLTTDGYEQQFGTNHMGHALLTKLLLPLLLRTSSTAPSLSAGDVRIISLSSHGHTYAASPGIDFSTLKNPAAPLGALRRYSQSKLANVLFARHLARLYDSQLTAVAVHPGVVHTQLMDKAGGFPAPLRALTRALGGMVLAGVEVGVRNQLWASVAGLEDGRLRSGEYYEPVGVAGVASKYGVDDELAERLWEWTEKELEAYLSGAAA